MITVSATINAPIEKVWDCFTNPAHITGWYFASDDWHAPYAENNLQTGGSFKTRMEAKDGSFGFDMEGVYALVEPFKSFKYKMPDGRMVIVTFESLGNATTVTEKFDPESQNPHEMQQQGWQAILHNFKRYTEQQP